MTNQFARTVGVFLLVLLVTLSFIGFVAAQTPTPEPAPKLTYEKSAQVSGNLIVYTISVTNSGNSDSEEQTILDTLPAGADWAIVTSDIDCDLGPSSIENRLLLRCASFTVERRHINDTKDDFVNGSATVRVAGVVACGAYSNTALFLPAGVFRSTTAVIPCPETPTPTPIPPTPTPTSTPTQTPVPSTATPTATYTFIPTATPFRVVPLPPNTGNTQAGDSSPWLLKGIGVAAIVLAITSILFFRRHHE